MEDANVTDLPQPNTNTTLSVDDLIMEIGRQHVDKMSDSKEKNLFLNEISRLKANQAGAEKKRLDANTYAEGFKKSNDQYIANNQKLDKALVELRQELKVEKSKITELENVKIVKGKEIIVKEKEIQELKSKCVLLEKQVKKLTPAVKRKRNTK
jgi:hypothetical protein